MPKTYEPAGPVDQCETCLFWFARTGFGECRRRAPALNRLSPSPVGAWPTTAQDDWCGDFEVAFVDEHGNRFNRPGN